jgi:hypothetical protein
MVVRKFSLFFNYIMLNSVQLWEKRATMVMVVMNHCEKFLIVEN